MKSCFISSISYVLVHRRNACVTYVEPGTDPVLPRLRNMVVMNLTLKFIYF